MSSALSTARIVTAFALLLTLVVSFSAGADEPRAPVASPTIPAADPGWPRVYTTQAGGRLQIYQPQIASWDEQRHLVAYLAIAYHPAGAGKPALGTIKVEAETTVALEQRLVNFAALKIAETSFGSLNRDQVRTIVGEIERAMPDFERVIALDRVLASLDKSQIRPRNVEGVKAEPPKIVFSTIAAVLVCLDGDPVWSPIPDNDLRYAVNTNWDLFEHGSSKTLFLRHGNVWLKAATLSGPWMPAGTLPASFARLPSDANWKEVKASLPGRGIPVSDVPVVHVATSPTELILLRGAPSYVPVAGGNLLWVDNTESDLFRRGKDGPVYYLVAGRWFSAPGFDGPWTFATPTLPDEFRRIGVEHPRSRVLASVPGTPQAAEAVLLAQIPQTARVNKRELKLPDVIYQGAPQFAPIEGTAMQRAVNTNRDVIRVGDRYYLCLQGVWFVSVQPSGPWTVSGALPDEIHTIPVSSPVYHVTYVTVVEDGADHVVVATRAGYTGVTVAWGCAVWGTGWYHPPYVYYGGLYPVYYPYYPTYGYSAWYNPWAGTYARGAGVYGPYGGMGAGALYNPATGTYARGAMAWTPYGAEGVAQAYNPRTGTFAQTRQGAGVYGSWGSTYVQRGDDWAQTARATNEITGMTGRVTRTDDGAMVSGSGPRGSGFVAAGEDGVFAGRDGSVYKRAEGGGWQKYENGEWGQVQKPGEAGAAGQLERDRSARVEGAQRARDRGALASGGARNAGSYRPRAGGARAGGARGGRRR
jgi:hypothetical protein